MQIKILSDNELSQTDREQIHRLDLLCFGQKGVDQEPIYYFAPTFKHILLFEDQHLVSYLRTVLREAKWAGNKILIGGIGSVETEPEYQGKGLAGIILEEAMKTLKEQNADFGLLQTNIEIGAKLYGKVGFIPADRPYEVLDVNNTKRTVKAKDVMIAPIKNPQLVKDIMNSDKVLFIGKGDW
jgi:predicted acetyltransferase